jgi:ATP-dependent DNA helicase PIF1
MYDHSLDLESITGQRTGQRILLPRIDLTPSDSTIPFSFTKRQFSIRIAFAMIAQGQTLDKVGLYLLHPVFSHGQLYVAMSRVRFFEKLKIQIISNNKKDTMNIVYKEILQYTNSLNFICLSIFLYIFLLYFLYLL